MLLWPFFLRGAMAINYTRLQEVKNRLAGKVSFTDDPEDLTAMSEQLFRRLCAEAEAEIDLDMSSRYEVPLVASDSGTFEGLPESSKNILRTLSEIYCVTRVLETDFAMNGGGAVDAQNLYEQSMNRYKQIMEKLTGTKKDGGSGQNQFKYPPLKGLRLAYFNSEADDGFRGMVLVSRGESNSMDFAGKRINSPSESFFTVLDEDQVIDI